MPRVEHFVYAPETVYGTWVTPTKAIPVESVELQTAREAVDLRVTGAGRGLYERVLGAKPVNGSLVCPWWTSYIATIFKSFLRDTATTGAGPYTHTFLPDDTADLLGLSIQEIYSASLGLDILSATVNAVTINAAVKEAVKLTFELEAKDEALAGGTWDYSGGAAPALVASPGSLYPAIARPLMFYDAAIVIGGTPSIASKIISVAAGTAYVKVANVEIKIDNGLDTDGYGLVADPTRQELPPGNREITCKFEISWTDYSTTLYAAARAGTAMAFQLNLVGLSNAEAHVIIPSLFFDPAKLPAVAGDSKKRTLSLTGKAQLDSVTAKDINVWIKSGEATV